MFTGIINHLGILENSVHKPNHDLLITIKILNKNLPNLALGFSISCNGVCLTLIEKQQKDDYFYLDFQVSSETLSKTTIGNWKKDDLINIEFSLKIGDELGGHYVLGHVDSVTKIKAINKIADSHQFIFAIPADLAKFICFKGAVAINGISLTVNEAKIDEFVVNIIPYTYQHTNLQNLKIGDLVNLEIDIFARYLQRYNSLK